MNILRIYSVLLRQIYLLKNSFVRVIPLFIWCVIDIVLWGFMTKYLTHTAKTDLNFTATLLGAVLLWEVLVRIMLGFAQAFLEDSWSRNFLNIFAAPITLPEYISGLILASIFTSLIGITIMLVITMGFFGLSLSVYGFVLVPFVLILIVYGIALGILSTALLLLYGPSAEWLMWPIPTIISPFVGVFYPLNILPVWMQKVSQIFPPSYVFEAMRKITSSNSFSTDVLIRGTVLDIIFLGLSIFIFNRVYRKAARDGLLARYSSEGGIG